jgi:flavin-dependent dehydrogenase
MLEGEASLKQISQDWDLVIIGAGPAGAFAAYLLAQFSSKILLVDKSHFPRPKVCGCCINNAAISLLESNSLAHVLADQGAVQLKQLCLFDATQRARINLPRGVSLSRNRFDSELVKAAMARGVTFVPGVSAQVLEAFPDHRSVQLRASDCEQNVNAKVVLVADGLNGRSLERHPHFNFVTETNSRFGCGTIMQDAPEFYQAGQIYMACASGGYVGLVRLEDGRVDVAAAIDRNFSRANAGPAKAAAKILQLSNLPVPAALIDSHWLGTEALTRKRKHIAGERIFILGDACGYAEPFTGEGIAWALTSAAGVVDLVLSAMIQWSPSLITNWQQKHKEMIQVRQDRSKTIALGLRNDQLRHFAMPIISSFPFIATSIINLIAEPTVVRHDKPQNAA